MKIRGFLHLYIGEEAVAVGVMEALQPEDNSPRHLPRTRPGPGPRRARHERIMAEMYGKQEGCARGRGGSMHLFDAETRFYGGNAIVGGRPADGRGHGPGRQDARRQPRHLSASSATARWPKGNSTNRSIWPALWQLAGAVHLRKQPLRHGHRHRVRPCRHRPGQPRQQPTTCPREAVDGMDVLAVEEAAQEAVAYGARDRRALLPGMPHLPLPRPLDVRRRAVSRQERSSRVEGARPDRALEG